MASRLLPLLLVSLVVSCCWGLHSRMSRRGKHGVGAPPCNTKDLPPDMWFTQVLDHSDPANNSTWQQRYWVVTDYYSEGGPAFVMISGEAEASSKWMVNGSWIDDAKKYNAIIFQLEHRFYGESQPTSDTSVENLQYLTSEQALADVAYFVSGMNSMYNLSDTKWIAHGGSYSGNLAAWVRYKYPHLIHGANSASGPVLAKVDFYEYMNVVRNSLATYGTACSKAVESADKAVKKLLKKAAGRKTVDKLFKLCDPIDSSNQNDIYNLLESLSGNFADVVQYNKDNRFTSPMNITIDTVCDIMTKKSLGTVVKRYAAVNTLLMDYYEESCLDYSYDSMIEDIRNASWDGDGASSGERQWTYQTCTEFGYYQTSENSSEFFSDDFPLSFFLQQCSDIFGDAFSSDMVYSGVDRTNIMYGGLDLEATRVVCVHGSIDPWHALGITSTKLTESPAIFINGTAHCANMYPPRDSDLPALTAAREEVTALIGQWLQEDD